MIRCCNPLKVIPLYAKNVAKAVFEELFVRLVLGPESDGAARGDRRSDIYKRYRAGYQGITDS